MQRLEVNGAVRPIYGLLGVKRLKVCDNASSYRLMVDTANFYIR